MYTKSSVNSFKSALLYHRLCSGSRFFRRLESEFYCPAEIFFHIIQDMSRCQKHGNMTVMSAGVHNALIFTGIFESGDFLYGKSVNVCSQQDGFSRFSSLDGSQHSCFQTAIYPRNAYLVQFFLDYLAGVILFCAHFRMSVEVTAHFNLIIIIF